MKSFLKTASRAVAALFAVALVTMGVASPAFADDATGTVTSTITNARTGESYSDLATATEKAQSGDTIKLGEGNYTLYGVSSVGHTKGKDLTFEGLGTDKTAGTSVRRFPTLHTMAPSTTATTPLTAPAPLRSRT